MSEEKQQHEPANDVINELKLEDRLLASYIGKQFTLAKCNNEDIVFIRGEKDNKSIDMIMTFSGLIEMVEVVQKSIKNDERPKELDSVEPTE